MRKGSDLINKVVVTYNTGERVERIKDLLFDQDSNQLLGFLVTEGGWLSSGRAILLQDVQALGPNAVVIPSKDAIAEAKKIPKLKQILKRNNVLKGTRIMTTDGRDLGTMVDLYFNESTGAVEGYEVSGGLFADIYSGRSFVPAPQTLHIGEDIAFVPPEIADLMQEQVGGIKGAAQTAGGKLQETTQVASQRIQEATQAAGDQLQETTQVASQRIQETTQAAGQRIQEATQAAGDQLQETTLAANGRLQEVTVSSTTSLTNTVIDPTAQKEFAVGKTANQDVMAANGVPLIAQGQPITPLVVAEAESRGLLDQLYRAAGGSLSEPASQKLQASAQAAKVSFQEATRNASERLQGATRTSTASLTNAAVDPAAQKAFVIGKTVNQVIVAPDGTQLIDAGEQVTLLVAEVAESLGVLDQLYRATGGSLTVRLNRAANTALAGRMLGQAKGRRVHEAVRTQAGSFIAAPGQIVTEQVIERARTSQKELELLSAVGLTPRAAAHSSASSFLSGTGKQLRGGASQAQENVGTLWERIKEKAIDVQHSSAQTLEKQRIKRALGRPVTRVILDPQDEVILNVGELITHQAIEYSRQGGVLDILLSSVYDKQPDLSTQELRASEPGKASLERETGGVPNGKERPSYQPLLTTQ